MFLDNHPSTSSRPFDRGRDMRDDTELTPDDPNAVRKAKALGALMVTAAVIAAPFIANRESHHEAAERAALGNVPALVQQNIEHNQIQDALAHGENPAAVVTHP